MKYYVVSEEDLHNLRLAAWDAGSRELYLQFDDTELEKAEAACRAREVRPERVSISLGQMLDAWVAADYKEPDPELYRNRQRKPRT